MKLKTHSGTKKRFKVNAKGKVKSTQSCVQHIKRKLRRSQIRNLRGMEFMSHKQETKNILKYFLPYSRCR